MTSRSRVTGVAEIVLSVVDLPRMREFYEEVLGFELLSQACYLARPATRRAWRRIPRASRRLRF